MDFHQAWRDMADAVKEDDWHQAAEIVDNLIHGGWRGTGVPWIE